MDLRALLSEHPEARSDLDKMTSDARAEGEKAERVRVCAHLENIGHSPEAVTAAIKEGKPYDAASMSAYMNAGLKQQSGQDRSKDNPGAVATDDGGGGGDDQGVQGGTPAVFGKAIDAIAADSKENFNF